MPRPFAVAIVSLALAFVVSLALGGPRLLAQDLRENEPLSQLPVPEPGGGVVTPGIGIANFVRYVYLFGISFVAVAAAVSIMYGGARYMFSAIPGVKEDAKDRITNAGIGLALALGAFIILRTINPDLVSFKPIEGDFLHLEEPAQPGSGRIVIQPGDACSLAGPNLCAAGSTCRPDFLPGSATVRPDSTTGATCQTDSTPQVLGNGQDCSRNPNACGPNLQCTNVSGHLVCTPIPPAAGVPENDVCETDVFRGQGNCGIGSNGRPLTCVTQNAATRRGTCRAF
ncbi:hypothetical protein HYZ80_03985 [Candidatus Parcubacteria bacterium]|nr:hypothetical protein [Candidatus Parcubacteria bacterium]